jgi:hypothetical protein
VGEEDRGALRLLELEGVLQEEGVPL